MSPLGAIPSPAVDQLTPHWNPIAILREVLISIAHGGYTSNKPAFHDLYFSKSFTSPSSSITSTPSCCALVSLEPASTPAITRSVFLETLPVTFAPNACSRCLASSQVKVDNVPVGTIVFPASGCYESTGCSTIGQLMPACISYSITSRCGLQEKKHEMGGYHGAHLFRASLVND